LDDLEGIEISTQHSQRLKGSGEEDLVSLGIWPEAGTRIRLQRADLKERLTDAIRNLPERERLVMNLSYHEDSTLKQIGIVLDEPEPCVSQIHSSAICICAPSFPILDIAKASCREARSVITLRTPGRGKAPTVVYHTT
jgi:hypothetical protein